MAVSAGTRLGSYEILGQLAAGGMGEVWRARHLLLGRPAAVKLIRTESLGSASDEQAKTLLRRFEREARATSALRSPHTVQVYDFGVTDDGGFYYVMELLEGLDLHLLVEQQGPFPAERVIYILSQVCESLAEAHRSDLIHRDIKPANILLTETGLKHDFAKVLDFGLVLRAPDADWPGSERVETRLTVEGIVTGSPAYMAPELIQGSPVVDGRADLYSLGCAAYWLLTGQLVFPEPNVMRTIAAHLNQLPEPPSSRCELEIPRKLEQIVLACLEKDPQNRPASAEALAHELNECPVKESWSEQRAEAWWRLHHPAGAGIPSAGADSTPEWNAAAAQALPGVISEVLENKVSNSSGSLLTPPTPSEPLRAGEGSFAGAAAAESEPEFALPRRTARTLFLTIQAGYLVMYLAALFEAEALQLPLYRAFMVPAGPSLSLVIAFTMCSIAVRLYLLSSVGFDHPAAGAKFRRLFPALLVIDGLWSAAPLLLVNKLGLGLPLFGVAALAYLPFSQRTLIQSIYPLTKATGSGTLRSPSANEAAAQSAPPRPGP